MDQCGRHNVTQVSKRTNADAESSLTCGFRYKDPACIDFLMKDVCKAYYDFGQCYLYQARVNCRKTCKVCGEFVMNDF